MTPFKVQEPSGIEIPVVVSVPHCGTYFPDELRDQYKPHLIQAPDDTDWYVDKLYDFAPSMGMTMISAVFSRWVIDLNRDPESKPLYADGRIITGLCPTTDFRGEYLYVDQRTSVSKEETERRLTEYYWPYHAALKTIIEKKLEKFGTVLLWDCHSVRQHVPLIFKDKFPDLILGSADETSASGDLIDRALEILSRANYSVSHNHPFKGGYITRHYGKPSAGVHALQLEMTKVNYMEDQELSYDPFRANKMKGLLKEVLRSLADKISEK